MKKKKKNNRRIWIPVLLCLVLLGSVVLPFIPSVFAKEQAVEIEWNGETVDSVGLEQDAKETLTAVVNGMEAHAFQWQIFLAPQSIWVSIADRTAAECEISVALLNTMLDQTNCAYLRCAVTGAEETVFSDAVCITVLPQSEQEAQSTAEEQLHAIVADSTRMRSIANVYSTANAAVLNSGSGSEEDDGNYVTITIKYLESSSLGGAESPVFSSYVATILEGDDFHQSVVSPTYLGFAPYLDSNGNGSIDSSDASANSVELNYTGLTTDQVINVYYKPIEVPFAVRFFFQNISDDLYTEDTNRYHAGRAETGTIITDERIASWEGDTQGFTSLYHVPQSVAADGSTVFECYYDRNYYLIQFDLDGGYGVAPIYARYGAAFVVNTPIRAGYRFDGWQLYMIDQNDNGAWDDAAYPSGEGGVSILTAVPSHNYYYKAKWEADNSSYTTVYWLRRNDGSMEYLTSKTTTGVLSGSPVVYAGDLPPLLTCEQEEHTHDRSCYTHVCNISCYTTQQVRTWSQMTDLEKDRLNDVINEKIGTMNLKKGFVYRYRPSLAVYRNYLNLNKDGEDGGPKRENWYYLGNGNDYGGVNIGNASTAIDNKKCLPIQAIPLPNHMSNASASVLICDKTEHTHGSACYSNPPYVYDSVTTTSENAGKTVAGDGTTVVNVFYRPKEYTLRFYYAAQESDGKWEIVGGSTYPFGHSSTVATDDDILLLDGEFNAVKGGIPHVNIGRVTALPQMNARGNSRVTAGSYHLASTNPADSADRRTYYYFEFTAEYGQDISELWPVDVFEPATRADKPLLPPNGWSGNQAFVSAWNGEYYVKYSVDHNSVSGGNETIKGKQERLGDDLLFDVGALGNVTDPTTVSFLCFWENGVDNLATPWNVPNLFVYNIWVPILPGDVPESGDVTKVKNGITYKRIDSYPTCDNSDDRNNYENQTTPSLIGFQGDTSSGTDRDGRVLSEAEKNAYGSYQDGYEVNFYYARMSYPFSMQNRGEEIVPSTGVLYETKLSTRLEGQEGLTADPDYTYRPDYPASLEEGAYEFQGWYTTDQCFPGTEFDLSTGTMPARGVILYAKWELVQHTVNFFSSMDEMKSFEDGSVTDWSEENGAAHWKKTLQVRHGNDISVVVTAPERSDPDLTDLRFAGWFYLENGQKKALTAQNMPITKDLNVFADWRSRQNVPYRIQYVLADDETVKVADDSTGEAFSGSTRTFTAKAGNQLWEDYRSEYFPTVSSHSINLHTGENTDTFRYVHVNSVNYTVRYLNKTTGEEVLSPDILSTSSAAVTARFKAVSNMVPDAFYKSLVLQVDYDAEAGQYVGSAENVITFYYIPNDTTAFYAVHFMLEKLGATDAQKGNYAVNGSGGYAESGTMIEGVGDQGQNARITPQEMAGFELIESPAPKIVQSNGTESYASKDAEAYLLPIQEAGTELYFFYRRLSYPYRVRYDLYNSETPVPGSTPVNGSATPYGSTVSFTAPQFSDYTLVSPSTQSITINVEPDDEECNTVIFYYTPKQYVAEYVAVPAEGGWLSLTIEVVNGSQSLTGSTPTSHQGYDFEGWYLDAGCTTPVTAANGTVNSTTNAFTPNRSSLSISERNIFYAKFVASAADFTITRSGAESDQVFVYAVRNNETGNVVYVTVTGNGSATIHDLPMGEYTVTQQNDWSWRHDDSAITNVSHSNPAGTTVTFSQAAQTDQWINGNSPVRENIGGS